VTSQRDPVHCTAGAKSTTGRNLVALRKARQLTELAERMSKTM
jgi:hypothetical protein